MHGAFSVLLRNPKAAIGLAIVVFYVVIALAAPLITSHDPNKRVARPHQPPSIEKCDGLDPNLGATSTPSSSGGLGRHWESVSWPASS